jgi:hypothetical protein
MVPLRSKPCRGALAERDRERVGVAAKAGSQEPSALDAGVDAVAIPPQASVGSKTRSAGRNLLIFSTVPIARG